jgi:ribosomal protein S1
VFVELDQGVEGLIHISEMSWTQHIKHPSQLLNQGDEVEAIVLNDFFKNKEDAECKAYLSSHKPNLATLGDVMPKLESE